jgi:hypothetical protein
MKINFKGSIILLAGAALLLNACTKSQNAKPSTTTPANTVNKQTAASQIAVNLYQSLTGQYGGVNINNGISTPAIASSTLKTPTLNSTNFVCGFYVNDGINYTTNIGDTLKSVSHGSLAFYYVCNSTQAIGYKATDTLTTIGTGPGYAFADGVSQNYIVSGLNSNNSLVTVDGSIKSTIGISYNKGGKIASYNVFTLSGLQVHLDQNPPDITSGTALFVTSGVSGSSVYSLEGKFTFLGNHIAKIDYYDSIFYVNLITGKVTTTI